MKYCIDYYNHFPNYEKADEYTIKYTGKINVLIDFLEKHNTKRINLVIEDELTDLLINDLKEISKKYSNLYFKFEYYSDEIAEIASENELRFFFATKASNWDTFLGLLETGVTDIYVVEDLCFDLERVSAVAHNEDVQLRTYANVTQSSWKYTPEIKTFWIRPEDIDIYEKYIDVLEFFGDPNHISVLLKIYKEDKQWFGKLKEIIIGIKSDLDSRYILPDFAERRISCDKKCLKDGKCRICDRIVDIAEILPETNLIIKKKKEKENR